MRRTEIFAVLFLLVSNLMFTLCAPLARMLYDGNWEVGSVLILRVIGTAALLLLPLLHLVVKHWEHILQDWKAIVIYGIFPVAGMLSFFFLSVKYLSVSIAVLLTMFGPVMVVLWMWFRTKIRPPVITFIGIAIALAGVIVLLDPSDAHVEPLGIIYGIAGTICYAIFIMASATPPEKIPQTVFTGMGFIVGAVIITGMSLLGVLPLGADTINVPLGDGTIAWWIAGVALILCTYLGYITSILGFNRIDPGVGSFIAFSSVPFAIILAWVMLGEAPTVLLLFGSAAILIGVALIKIGDLKTERAKRLSAEEATVTELH